MKAQQPLFEPSFNRAVKVRGGQDRLSSDAGMLLLREADHRLDLTPLLAAKLSDCSDQDRARYRPMELLRERLCAMAQGCDAQDDVDELAHDPAMRLATWLPARNSSGAARRIGAPQSARSFVLANS
jgi:hypothetical protein